LPLRRRPVKALLQLVVALLLLSSAGADWLSQMPPNLVTLDFKRRNHVFYVGEAITARLSNPAPVVGYEIRDYWGNVVERGPGGEFIFPQVRRPGWYKVYLRGAQNQEPWGEFVGGTMFVILRDNPNFPRIPAPQTYGGEGLVDGVMRGIAAIGPNRHVVDAADPAGSITRLARDVAVDQQYYPAADPARPRKLMAAFATGTTNLNNVRQIVEAFKNDVKYWEPRNEPNFDPTRTDGTLLDPAAFVNNELRPFYETVKSVDPSLKVLGPGVVTIGPAMHGWLEGFFAAGGASYLDGFSFHAYNNVNGDPELIRRSMDYLNDLLARHNATHLERWQTEQGYFAAIFGPYQPRLQARWSMLQMLMFEQYGLPKEQNHLWYDKSGGFWAESRWWENADGSLNPVVPLMRVWSEELFGKTFTRRFDFGPAGNKLFVGTEFQGAGKKVAAFLTAGSTDGAIELNVSGDAAVRVVSSFGETRSVPVQAGRVTLPITELPTYVEFTGTLEVTPFNAGTNFARLPGTTAAASGSGVHPIQAGTPNSLSKIINGELENWYWTQESSARVWMDDTPQFPAWVEVNLPSAQTIDTVIVYAGVPWQWDGSLLDYDLQYQQGGQWITLATVNEPPATFRAYTPTNWTTIDSFYSDRCVFRHTFAPVTAQKIRLFVRNATVGGGATPQLAAAGGQTGAHKISLREIEVYATGENAVVNTPPIALGRQVTTQENRGVEINVLDQDYDSDGPQPLRLTEVGAAANGLTSIVGETLRYGPRPGFTGTDSFTYTISDGAASATATVQVSVTAGEPVYPTFGGLTNLRGQYFGTTELTQPTLNRPETNIDFNWVYDPPDWSLSRDFFSARWTGQVQPRYSETYTFYTMSDAGVRLWIDGQLLIDHWTYHGPTEDSWTIALEAGRRYDLVMEYVEDAGTAVAQLFWSSPSQAKEIVPRLPTAVTGGYTALRGEYFDNIDLTNLRVTRHDAAIDFDFGGGAPDPSIGNDSFSVRWTGQIQAQYSEPYTFYAITDDGVRMWLDGQQVIDDWRDHGPASYAVTIPLEAGRRYDLRLEYYDNLGGALARLWWSSPSQVYAPLRRLPEETWRLQSFNAAQLADSAISGSLADPDRDGRNNKLEYAFVRDPQIADAGMPTAPELVFENGRRYLALSYWQNIDATDLTFTLEASDALGGWLPAFAPEEILGADGDGNLLIRRRLDVTDEPQQFIRLRIF